MEENQMKNGRVLLARAPVAQLAAAVKASVGTCASVKQASKRQLLGCVLIEVSQIANDPREAVMSLTSTDSTVLGRVSIPVEWLGHSCRLAVDARALLSFLEPFKKASGFAEVVVFEDLSSEHASHCIDGRVPDAENAYGTSVSFFVGNSCVGLTDSFLQYPGDALSNCLRATWSSEKAFEIGLNVEVLEKMLASLKASGHGAVKIGFVNHMKPAYFKGVGQVAGSHGKIYANAEGIIVPVRLA